MVCPACTQPRDGSDGEESPSCWPGRQRAACPVPGFPYSLVTTVSHLRAWLGVTMRAHLKHLSPGSRPELPAGGLCLPSLADPAWTISTDRASSRGMTMVHMLQPAPGASGASGCSVLRGGGSGGSERLLDPVCLVHGRRRMTRPAARCDCDAEGERAGVPRAKHSTRSIFRWIGPRRVRPACFLEFVVAAMEAEGEQ